MKCDNCGQKITMSDINTEIYEISNSDAILYCNCECGDGFFIECTVNNIRKDKI
ncbi:MAG: hypothetical protein ACQEQF_13025 [Bacillota bacterium]